MLYQTVSPKARIKNYGSVTQTNFTAVCSIISANNNIRYTNTQTVSSLSTGDTAIVNFSNWTPTIAEVCTVKIRTNLVGDQNPNNDAQTKLTTILMSFINEGFNSYSFPPAGWQAVIGNGTYNWERFTAGTNPTCTPYEGAGMAGYRSYSATDGNWARLISPAFTLSSVTPCSLKFHMTLSSAWPSDPDSIIIETSTNGTTFTQVAGFTRLSTAFAWVEQSVFLGNLPVGTNYIAFKALSAYGDNMYLDNVRVNAPMGIEENPNGNIYISSLNTVKPNPVRGIAHISFNIANPSQTNIKIYDASGRIVKTLVNSHLDRGTYNLTWNGTDDNNRQVSEGIYFYTLETENNSQTKKLVLTR
jgi:hypothetical protein